VVLTVQATDAANSPFTSLEGVNVKWTVDKAHIRVLNKSDGKAKSLVVRGKGKGRTWVNVSVGRIYARIDLVVVNSLPVVPSRPLGIGPYVMKILRKENRTCRIPLKVREDEVIVRASRGLTLEFVPAEETAIIRANRAFETSGRIEIEHKETGEKAVVRVDWPPETGERPLLFYACVFALFGSISFVVLCIVWPRHGSNQTGPASAAGFGPIGPISRTVPRRSSHFVFPSRTASRFRPYR
jgi:hypothetical protein